MKTVPEDGHQIRKGGVLVVQNAKAKTDKEQEQMKTKQLKKLRQPKNHLKFCPCCKKPCKFPKKTRIAFARHFKRK